MDLISRVRELARNMWWTWHPNVIAVLRDIDPTLWRKLNHNPISFVKQLPREQVEARAAELALDARVNHVFHRLKEYLETHDAWGDVYGGPLRATPVAYLSAEFGLHESLPIYSGGLGILAGDHLKSASDLGIPVVGIGLLYAQGYFNQRLDANGWQQESYSGTDIGNLPMEPALCRNGKPVRVRIKTRSETVHVGVWRIEVGRSSLLLLDSDVAENSDAVRQLTGRLYGGDERVRIMQELILGVGGMRALKAVGLAPGALHLNEGHCAFAPLELARQEMEEDGVDFHRAMRRVRDRTAFTTHTPVEAGHDRFNAGLVEDVLGPLRDELRLAPDEFMALGRVNPRDGGEPFCMTVLALKAARKSNAVSALHGRVSRQMWQGLWPDRAVTEVPIGHITNGVHVASWIAAPVETVLDTYLGAGWKKKMYLPETWASAGAIDDAELWEAHQVVKTRLLTYMLRHVCDREEGHGNEQTCRLATERLDTDALTIGFARRFAPYKRGDLILADAERLARLVTDPKRPIQIIFAGKAHPNHEDGKRLIQRIYRLTRDERLQGRIVFLDDYDINVGRHLVQGCDLWLACPRRPREACSTSGMKALYNGVLNMSILDGWWAEAYDGECGFAYGGGRQHADDGRQDERDATDLYRVLEETVIPMYYDKDAQGIPREWVKRAKYAMRRLGWRFNADRMLMEYARECYLPMVGATSIDGIGGGYAR
ncbi:MAG: glycosyltransferase family 1 protein [Lentisphaerae bacterium]|nr:glycosyltransferase family 1 protein [Lentisphaerota bacterium]